MDDILKCYQIIGVQPGTSPKAIKKAYRDLVKRWHPDRFPNDSQKRAEAEEKIKAINLAFERIQDHRETLIARARKTPDPPVRPPRPRSSAAPPRGPRPGPRPQAKPKPPPQPNSQPPRGYESQKASAKAAPGQKIPVPGFARWIRPVPVAVGSAVLLVVGAVTFIFLWRGEEPPVREAETERLVPLSEIEFRRSPPVVDRSSALRGELSGESARIAPMNSSPTPPINGVSSNVGVASAPAANDGAVDRALQEAQPSTARIGASTATRPLENAEPRLINESLKAKLIAKTESSRAPLPKPEETPDGQFRSAQRYAQGDGVLQDYAEAARLYRLAAEAGHAEAQKNLGFLYAAGKGVPANQAEAEKWFNLAGAQGIAGAKFAGALLALANTNAPTKAAAREVASAVDPISNREIRSPLLKALFQTNSLQTNRTDSAPLEASDRMDAVERYELGLRFETGAGAKQDYSAAVKWYRLAAEAGHAVAQKRLGDLYASGKGVAQDFAEAKKWYEKAAAGGAVGAALKRSSASSTNADAALESSEEEKQDQTAAGVKKK